jgi:hypothetical protein
MLRVVLVASLLAACAADPGSPPALGPAVAPVVVDDGGESSSGGAPEPEPDVPHDGPCPAVDLLFVIDNSRSMQEEQDSLVASFPGFIAGIEDLLGSQTSYHVGVVTTDHNAYNEDACREIGALTTRTGGQMSSDRLCGPFAGGRRYMTAADNLSEAFACAAHVGIEGDWDERPMEALRSVLTGDPPRTAACNEGFLRADALLVVILITDEDDLASVGAPDGWYDAIVSVRDERSLVLLSLVAVDDACTTEPSPRLQDLTERFPFGLVRDICAPSYDGFFAEAVEGIAVACEVGVI